MHKSNLKNKQKNTYSGIHLCIFTAINSFHHCNEKYFLQRKLYSLVNRFHISTPSCPNKNRVNGHTGNYFLSIFIEFTHFNNECSRGARKSDMWDEFFPAKNKLNGKQTLQFNFFLFSLFHNLCPFFVAFILLKEFSVTAIC